METQRVVGREWSESEFAGVDLGDKRLESRLKRIAGELAGHPEAPINQASEDWAATKAAYRFFQNEKTTTQAILSPHVKRTMQRMHGEQTVLAIQDTSYLNFSAHKSTQGLGPVGDSRSDSRGLVMHSTLAVTPMGLPLGLLGSKIWARKGYSSQTEYERKSTPIEKKESYRWIKGLTEVSTLTPPKVRVVTVCDRECDIYEFFTTAQALNSEFVIRASWNRNIENAELPKLWEQLENQKSVGTYQVSLIGNQKRAARIATVEVRFSKVRLSPSKRKSSSLPPLTLYAVYITEPHPSKDIEPIEWMLLTNIPVVSFEGACEKAQWYCCRWQIEVFHKILKSGCAVEQCRLETAERLTRYITLMCIVAWRIFWMTHLRRTNPKANASVILTQQELKTLAALDRGGADSIIPKMSVAQAVIAIAKLGGFLARKHDRLPGPTVLWRGWTTLQNASLLGAIVFK